MQTTIQTLIKQASQPDIPLKIRLLARNQAIDMEDIRSDHPDAAQCGGQIASGALASTYNSVQAPPNTANQDEQTDYHNRLETTLLDLMQPLLKQGLQGKRPIQAGTIQLTRFIDLNTVYKCWCGYKETATREQKYERFTKWQHQIQARLSPRQPIPKLAEIPIIYMARNEPGAVVWTTETTAIQRYTAREWVRRLALPGYESEQDYQTKTGLVAVEYTLTARTLHKPTVVEAQKHVHYLPGYQDESHGRTAPLDQQGKIPWSRSETEQGLIEYIHTNMTLEKAQARLRYVGNF